MALIHPQFDPVAFSIGGEGGWPVHWYGLTYLAAFLMFLFVGKYRAKKMPLLGFKPIELDDILFYGVLGVILGGRLGYVLFYKPAEFLANPGDIFKVWQGGMSFHGGFLGVLVAMIWYARKTRRNFWEVTDFIAPLVPLGLAAGRLGNFINGELWGRVSDGGYNWLMLFPQAVNADYELMQQNPALQSLAVNVNNQLLLPRHPSQLYQAFTEGVLLFILTWWFASKPKPRMAVTGIFVLGYGLARFTTEFFRQPDADQGFILLGWMTKGQMLSLPMVIVGLLLLVWAYRNQIYDWGKNA